MNKEEKSQIHYELIIHPPEGFTFKECPLCKNLYADDGVFENCMWCEIHKDKDFTLELDDEE